MPTAAPSPRRTAPVSRDFWVLAAYLVLLFLIGGASRPDTKTLILLRPLSVLVLGYGIARLDWQRVRSFPGAFALLLSTIALTALHLLPLPPALWTVLPGREVIAEIDRASGLGSVWRPVSMVPTGTRNALYALSVPLAVLLLAVRLNATDRARLLPLFLGFGFASGLLGVVQVAAGQRSTIFLYEGTMTGSAVGLFANRNHQAVLLACLFPLLAAWALRRTVERQDQRGIWFAAGGAVVLLPLILVVGSRAGLLCAVLAIGLTPLLVRERLAQAPRQVRRRVVGGYLLGCGAALLLGLVFFLVARAESIDRLLTSTSEDDRRLQVWRPVIELIGRYFPVGSGIGSYVPVFQLNEPADVLALNYSNHAHNDWLEVAMTSGLPGMVLLAAATGLALVLGVRAWRVPDGEGEGTRGAMSRVLPRTGSIVLLLLALASIGDYPLRVPVMMALLVVAFVWLEAGAMPPDASVASSRGGSRSR